MERKITFEETYDKVAKKKERLNEDIKKYSDEIEKLEEKNKNNELALQLLQELKTTIEQHQINCVDFNCGHNQTVIVFGEAHRFGYHQNADQREIDDFIGELSGDIDFTRKILDQYKGLFNLGKSQLKQIEEYERNLDALYSPQTPDDFARKKKIMDDICKVYGEDFKFEFPEHPVEKN